MAYSFGQLESIWTQAGGSPSAATVMAAIATAESGGDPTAISQSNDYGLWQINITNFATTGLNSSNWSDPITNARAAIILSSNGTNVGDWCTGWTYPGENCGSFLGPTPQSGSPAGNVLAQNGGTPASNVNLTNATTPASSNNSQAASSNNSQASSAEQLAASNLGMVSAIATYGPGILSQEWFQKQERQDVPSGVLGWLTKHLGLNSAITGTEVAAGTFAWITKPTTLLRAAEILIGAGILAIGASMYIQILLPGVSGIVGTIAGLGAGPAGIATKGMHAVEHGVEHATTERHKTQRQHILEEGKLQRQQERFDQSRYRKAEKESPSRLFKAPSGETF